MGKIIQLEADTEACECCGDFIFVDDLKLVNSDDDVLSFCPTCYKQLLIENQE